jgi:hypothetical protein
MMSRRVPPRIRANRQNAKKSTGPRTAAGKARAARNAETHSLNTPITRSPFLQERVIELTDAIAGPNPTAQRLEAAREVAAAQVHVERVCSVHETYWQRHAAQIATGLTSTDGAGTPRENSPLGDLISKVKPLPRYHKRALSLRKRAFQAFAKTGEEGEE